MTPPTPPTTRSGMSLPQWYQTVAPPRQNSLFLQSELHFWCLWPDARFIEWHPMQVDLDIYLSWTKDCKDAHTGLFLLSCQIAILCLWFVWFHIIKVLWCIIKGAWSNICVFNHFSHVSGFGWFVWSSHCLSGKIVCLFLLHRQIIIRNKFF